MGFGKKNVENTTKKVSFFVFFAGKMKIINKDKIALKLFVLIFLFNLSRFFIPENSILIK